MDPLKTLWQVYIGIGFYAVLFMLLGIIFMRPLWLFEISLLVGCMVACFAAYNIYDVLDRALELKAQNAKSFVAIRSCFRLLACLLVMGISIKIHWVSFVGVTIGLLGLKASAFFNPFLKKLPFVIRLTGEDGVAVTGEADCVEGVSVIDSTTGSRDSVSGSEAHDRDCVDAVGSSEYEDDEYEDEFVKKYFKKYTKQKDRYM